MRKASIDKPSTGQTSPASSTIMAAIARASLDALITIDSEGRIIEFGPSAEALFGYARDEAMGRDVAEIVIPPQLRQAHHDGMRRFFETGAGPVLNNRVEVLAHRKNGSDFAAELTVIPLIVDGQQMFTAFVRDISERVAQEQMMQKARHAAELADSAKTRFLANMSHELRTPLSAVLGSADLLLDESLSASQRLYAATIKKSAQALRVLVDDVLDFSRIEADEWEPDDVELDLPELISGAIEANVAAASERDLDLAYFIAPEVPQIVRSDGVRLRQIIQALLGNAIKYTEQGGIALRAFLIQDDQDKPGLRIEIQDTGVGISEADREGLFERFARVDDSESSRHSGAGLGLVTVRRLVQKMRGGIGVESEYGQGSVFWFELPIAVVREREHAASPRADARVYALSTSTVLQDVLRRQLTALGHRAEILQSARDLRTLSWETGMVALIDADGLDTALRDLEEALVELGWPGQSRIVMSRKIPTDAPPEAGGRYLQKPVSCESLGAALSGGPSTVVEDARPSAVLGRYGKLLLVEDGPANQMVAKAMLTRAGWSVSIAEDGREALSALLREPFDLVLMDLRMPGMDGLEATRQIRKLSGAVSAIPIIALTANSSAEDIENCRSAGMNDFARKPIDREMLLAKISKFVGAEASNTQAKST